MLIKKPDSQEQKIVTLERIAAGGGDDGKWAAVDLRNIRAGIRGEEQAAYLIDFHYGRSQNWCVIHDLRIESNGRVAQIDHLLINRCLDIYVLESKHFHAGVKITEDGEFMRWNNFKKRYEGMGSPIEQNQRHIDVLKDLLEEIELPKRFGIRIRPALHSYILISENATIIRPKKFDTSRVVKPGQLRARIWKQLNAVNPVIGMAKLIAKTVSVDTMEGLARALVAQHKPYNGQGRGVEQDTGRKTLAERLAAKVEKVGEAMSWARGVDTQANGQTVPALRCKKCSSSSGVVLYGKFGYYFKCRKCSENTAIRFSCQDGHTPRLRKEGKRFYRDCPQCGVSSLYYTNT